MLRWSVQLHKWIGLIVGLQVLGWVLGGFIMTVIPIEKVRGEQHIAGFAPDPLPADVLDLAGATAAAHLQQAPVEATLKSTLRGAVWVLKDAQGQSRVIDARTGAHMAPLTPAEARLMAGIAYEGPGKPVAVKFHREAPQEAGQTGPTWKVDFDDAEKTSLYLSPETGEVVARRSDLWRFYDFFWRIHILDFKTGENFNNPLIIAASALTLPMVVTGFILLWIKLSRDLHGVRARRAKRAGKSV